MKKTFQAACVFFIIIFLTPFAQADLVEQEQAIIEKYQNFFEQLTETGLNGGLKASNQKLIELTKKDPSTAMDLVVANMLYSIDRDNSYTLHKKAFTAKPNDQVTILEWAMEQHRKGEYAEAASLYNKYLKLVPEDVTKQALLADCLVRTGKLQEAVKAWNAAGHPNNHTGIDFAIFEIYGPTSPARRRDDLLATIQSGTNNVFERLIYLDVNYDQDWWNKEVNERALNSDLELAAKNLGKGSQRYTDLIVYGNLATNDWADSASIKDALTKAGLIIGEKGRLPESSLIAQDLVEKITSNKLATKAQLLRQFEKDLTLRAKSAPGDADALNLLCFLCIDNANAKLAEFDNYGWEHFGDAKFAGSYLAGLAASGKLNANSAALNKALQQFPEDSTLRQLQIQIVGKDKLTPEITVAAIKSEYRKLSVGMFMPDSYTLKGLFFLLNNQQAAK